MSIRRTFVGYAIACAALLLSSGGIAHAQEVTVLRIATLAPNGSSWMKVFNAWNKTLQKESGGTLKLRFYAGGSQGDERDFVRKMRAGQMDGASVTNVGLGQIVRPILVLTAPGVIKNYKELERVRTKLGPRFEKLFEDEGYKLLGWGDVGRARLFSTEKLEKPEDIRQMRPWGWKDDLIFPEFLKVVGANAVRLGVPEVYPALQTRMVDTLTASALAAVSLQWYTRLKYVSAESTGVIAGATLIRKDKFDALTPEQQKVLLSTSKRAHKALNKAIRRDDEKAYATILKKGVVPVDIGPNRAAWDKAADETTNRLAGRVFPKSLLKDVRAATKE